MENIFEFDGLFQASIAQVENALMRRNATIETSIDPVISSINGDQRALRQMLVNLLSNAIEFSHEGGRIEVALSLLDDGSAALSVRDFGIGMDPEKVDRVFVPFVQLDDALDRSHEGTGLGLPIVKALAEHHDAELNVETALGQGTLVEITLPASSVDAVQYNDERAVS